MDIDKIGDMMGLFDKFKNIFKKEEKEEVNLYDKGLEKTRNNFLT